MRPLPLSCYRSTIIFLYLSCQHNRQQITFFHIRILFKGPPGEYPFGSFGGNLVVEQVSSYYPFGMSHVGQPNSSSNKYLYNGKEKQDEALGGVAFDWYDYGARFYDPMIGRFHTQDRFAEKYKRWTPYMYCKNNPIKFIDFNGDSIRANDISRDKTATEKFNNINKDGTGGYYETTMDANGNVTLKSTGIKGPGMNTQQKAYYKMLKEIIDSETMVSINIADGDRRVTVGDEASSTIDVGDIEKIGDHKVLKRASLLGHELFEQYKWQTGSNPNDAHSLACEKEGEIFNYYRNSIIGVMEYVDPSNSEISTLNINLKYIENHSKSKATYQIFFIGKNFNNFGTVKE